MTTIPDDSPPLGSIDDLLTPEEQAELRADLKRIHEVSHPCWDRHPDCKCQRACGGDQ